MLAQFDDIDVFVVDIHIADTDFAVFDAGDVDQIIHAIEAAQEGGFAATGRADEGGHFLLVDIHVDIKQCLRVAVSEIKISDFYDGRACASAGDFSGCQCAHARK